LIKEKCRYPGTVAIDMGRTYQPPPGWYQRMLIAFLVHKIYNLVVSNPGTLPLIFYAIAFWVKDYVDMDSFDPSDPEQKV
jgi:hypothetical protein